MTCSSRKLSRLTLLSLGALVALAVFAVFFQATHFDFINFDDPDYISNNPVVARGLHQEGLVWAFTDTSTGHWHPLTWISLMLDVSLVGVNPHAHHAINIAFHSISSLLLFLLFARTTGRTALAFVVALIFGLHPLRIESVVWITERKDVLSMTLVLLALHSYASWVRSRQLGYYFSLVTLFTLSLLAKPTAVTFPALLLLFDLFPLQRQGTLAALLRDKKILLEKIPLVIIACAFSISAIIGQASGGGLQSSTDYPVPLRIESCLVGYLAYAARLFFPFKFGAFYPFQVYPPGVAVGALLALLGASAWVFKEGRHRPSLLFGWLWFLVSLLPMCGLVQVGGQALADRWSYLPHIGLITASVWYLAENLPLAVSRILAVACPLCLAAITFTTLPNWRDAEALFSETLRVSPDNFMAHTNLGQHYHSRGDLERARPHFEEAARLRPTYPQALNNLALTQAASGRTQDAVPLFMKAVELQPSNMTFRYNLGLSLSHTGKTAAALAEWIELLKYAPTHSQAALSARSVAPYLRSAPCSALTEVDGSAGIRRAVSIGDAWSPPVELLDLLELAQSLKRCSSF
jgi:tetratricopeptide (TPR) repeat protein